MAQSASAAKRVPSARALPGEAMTLLVPRIVVSALRVTVTGEGSLDASSSESDMEDMSSISASESL